MKKYLLLFFTITFAVKLMAQCTPDPNLNHMGFSPENLPPAYTDAPYNQVLSFHAPTDSSIVFNGSLYDVTIDSVILLDIKGIPSGFEYLCLNRCVIRGGETGCALLTGSADTTQIGNYPITTYVMTYFHLTLVPTSTFNRIDSSSSFTFRIYRTTGLKDLINSSVKSDITVYPNPANHTLWFDLSVLPPYSNGTITVYDALGREATTSTFTNNISPNLLVENYKAGIYRCKINSGTNVYYTTFIKE